MPATLEITSGTDAGKKIQLDAGRWRLGRGEDCDIRLQSGSISRHHAEILSQDGIWEVTDLQSQNGTFIEGQKITHAVLRETTKLRLGQVELLFTPGVANGSGLPTYDVTAPVEPEAAALPVPEPLPPLAETLVVATPAAAATTGSAQAQAPAPVTASFPGPASAPSSAETRADGTIDIDSIAATVREMANIYPRIEKEFGRAIVGQREVLEQLLIAIAANGHCLMIGLPGLAKTMMVSTLSKLLQLSFKRIQFTPDLMPSDIVGSEVLEVHEATGAKSFRFVKGPIFTSMLLADEINRTPPKTQAALLEAMQERQVTVANNVFPLPRPFFVLATQNPLEQEGTYPLPEAQLDRFLFNILVDYPSEAEEEEIVQVTTGTRDVMLEQVLSAEELLRLQQAVRALPASPHVVKYATRLVRATRPKNERAPDFIKENVGCGVGPRAAQHLILAAKAKAVMHGRLNVSCEDVRSLALPVMRHRIFTNFTADSEGVTPDDLIKRLLKAIPEPGPEDYPA